MPTTVTSSTTVWRFPIMLLTKTVSSRNRTHSPPDPMVHWAHLSVVALGILIAFCGVWRPSTEGLSIYLAIAVAVLALAAGTLFYDLVSTYKKEIDDKLKPETTAKRPSSSAEGCKGP